MALNWYILRTEPRAEYLAAAELGSDGYEMFFPRVTSPNHRVGHEDLPLFPGYLFLRCDPESGGWPAFRQRHRVSGWVRFGGVIPTMPDEVICELQRRVESINSGKGGLWRRFLPGETVRVVSHGVEGLGEVIQEAKTPQARARVLLQFMGQLVQAQVPWSDLRPVDDQQSQDRYLTRRTRGGGRWIRGFGPRAAVTRS